MISVICPTIRKEGLEIVEKALKMFYIPLSILVSHFAFCQSMMFKMRARTREKGKIINTVIASITVNMMHHFSCLKRAPEFIFHNQIVFISPLLRSNPNSDVSPFVCTSPAFPVGVQKPYINALFRFRQLLPMFCRKFLTFTPNFKFSRSIFSFHQFRLFGHRVGRSFFILPIWRVNTIGPGYGVAIMAAILPFSGRSCTNFFTANSAVNYKFLSFHYGQNIQYES